MRGLALALALSLGLTACGGPRMFGGSPSRGSYGKPTSVYPASGRYIVQRGDTVYEISRRFGVNMRDIIADNRLPAPYTLSIGQVIYLPAKRMHIVSRGETIYRISQLHNVDMSLLIRANSLRRPYTIYPGQRLMIPPSAYQARPTQVATRTVPPSNRDKVVQQPNTATAPQQTAKVAPPPKPKPSPVPAPPPRGAGKFLWPVRGRILSDYGDKGGGLKNDGINIEAPAGSPIHAADNGVVVYAGNELKGFGNLLLIKHADGWMTAYAHASSLEVPRGAQVKRGQLVAKVGKTGNVDKPQLHFETRRKKKAVDPKPFLDGPLVATIQ